MSWSRQAPPGCQQIADDHPFIPFGSSRPANRVMEAMPKAFRFRGSRHHHSSTKKKHGNNWRISKAPRQSKSVTSSGHAARVQLLFHLAPAAPEVGKSKHCKPVLVPVNTGRQLLCKATSVRGRQQHSLIAGTNTNVLNVVPVFICCSLSWPPERCIDILSSSCRQLCTATRYCSAPSSVIQVLSPVWMRGLRALVQCSSAVCSYRHLSSLGKLRCCQLSITAFQPAHSSSNIFRPPTSMTSLPSQASFHALPSLVIIPSQRQVQPLVHRALGTPGLRGAPHPTAMLRSAAAVQLAALPGQAAAIRGSSGVPAMRGRYPHQCLASRQAAGQHAQRGGRGRRWTCIGGRAVPRRACGAVLAEPPIRAVP
jgi:hypothetical protein